ncbi:MAG: FKBP-type peptidyl-prolyl cis-trans isomerase [Bacteroidales bacterium]|nr:MAG: FKBP-type peptidyl-prolyl cis-trans isomerase [Bacteroidales bacterium]
MKTRTSLLTIAIAIFISSSCSRTATDTELRTENDSISYLTGMVLASNMKEDGFETMNPVIVAKAFDDVFNERELLFDPYDAQTLLREFYQKLNERKLLEEYEPNKQAGELFLEQNKAKEGVVTLPSGLQYKVLDEGNGPKPQLTDRVQVHYRGSLVDGTVFESSFDGDPAVFGVNGLIPGWTEALQLMNVGSTWEIYIPQDLAYGTNVRPGGAILPFSALIFEIRLIAIEEN